MTADSAVLGRPVAWVRPADEEEPPKGVTRRLTYLRPDAEAWDPFILLGEDWFGKGSFSWHPHRGFETVTYVVDGRLRHRDSRGNEGTIGRGDVQWMTAGSGVLHDEEPEGDSVRGLQLWLNLPARHKMTAPGHTALRGAKMPAWQAPGFEGRVFAGTFSGVRGPHVPISPASFMDLKAEAGKAAAIDLTPNQAFCVVVLRGSITLNGRHVPAQASAWLPPVDDAVSSEVRVETTETSHVLFYGGQPIREPTVLHMPFVMSTEAEIQEAFADLQAGVFGRAPRDRTTRPAPRRGASD